jgi:hypothetical protein
MNSDIIPLSEAFDDTPLFRERLQEEQARVRGCHDQIKRITQLQHQIASQMEELSKQRMALIDQLDQPLFDEKVAGPLKTFQRNLKEVSLLYVGSMQHRECHMRPLSALVNPFINATCHLEANFVTLPLIHIYRSNDADPSNPSKLKQS